MTATARSSAEEFQDVYDLRVVSIPSHEPCVRIDHPDSVFATLEAKRSALLTEIVKVHALGRPVLVGTESIAESEVLSERLRNAGIDCSVLNAKNDELEANIIAEAGLPDAVTISTNMAGRGTDIRLGGADERERARVLALGGLHVVASCRHESRRIDDQLRGRAGRQGDPGSSRMLVSLEDALVQRFGLVGMVGLERLGEGHPHAGREIARAQRIVEGQNFEIRRTLNQYSAVMEDQRRLIEARREAILQGDSEQRLLFDECSSRNEHLLRDLGPQALGEFQDQVMLRTLDLCWSDHLDRMAVIRRGIHLVQLAGRPPLDAFLRQAFEAFESLVETIEHESLRVYLEIGVGPEGVDWEGAGLLAPSATWTYTINDDRIESNLIRDLAYNPMILLGAVWMIPMLFLYALWQRLRNRSK
jgi:preprotein translocase subunit SecA